MLHPLDSTIFLYSRSKEYVYFNHLSIQQLYMLFLLNISFIRVATIFVLFFLRKSNLSMWFESFQHMWVPFMASSHFQLLYIKDLILHTIGLLIAWLICQLNASTLIVTLVMIHQNQVDMAPENFCRVSSPYPCPRGDKNSPSLSSGKVMGTLSFPFSSPCRGSIPMGIPIPV